MTKITIRNLQPQDNILIDIDTTEVHGVMGSCGFCLYTAPIYSPPVYSPPVYIPACTY